MKQLLSALTWRRWFLITLALLIVIGGIIYGFGSHQVTYRKVTVQAFTSQVNFKTTTNSQNTPTPSRITLGVYEPSTNSSISVDANGVHLVSDRYSFYILNVDNFSPDMSNVDTSSLVQQSLSLIYRPDDTTNVDITTYGNVSSQHLTGTGYKVVQISLNGKTFTTNEYKQNPDGFYQNNWLTTLPIALFGIIIGSLVFFWPVLRRNRKQAIPLLPAEEM